MAWNFFSSEKVAKALGQQTQVQDLSPSSLMPVNNDSPPLDANGKPRRMWLEGWSEKDEARLRDDGQVYLA